MITTPPLRKENTGGEERLVRVVLLKWSRGCRATLPEAVATLPNGRARIRVVLHPRTNGREEGRIDGTGDAKRALTENLPA